MYILYFYITVSCKSKRESVKWCSNPSINAQITHREFEMLDNCDYYLSYGNAINNNKDNTIIISSDIIDKMPADKKQDQKHCVTKSLTQIKKEVYSTMRKTQLFNSKMNLTEKAIKDDKSCHECFHFKYVPIAGQEASWCFNKNIFFSLPEPKKMNSCTYLKKIVLPFEFDKPPGDYSIRNKKIRSFCLIYRYLYNIFVEVAFITSRYDHWAIVGSVNNEQLYHKNSKLDRKTNKLNANCYHLQKTFADGQQQMCQLFRYIYDHDHYVLENRVLRSVPIESLDKKFDVSEFDLL